MIKKVLIKDIHKEYLLNRRLIKQYLKAEDNLLAGNFKQVDFKLRKPKSAGIYSFRINKKYRAFGKIEDGNIFKVIEISDHQK